MREPGHRAVFAKGGHRGNGNCGRLARPMFGRCRGARHHPSHRAIRRQISGAADQDHRAVRAGRLDRHPRPRARPEDAGKLGPAGDRGDAAGRRHRDRHRRRGAGRARRLHAAHHGEQSSPPIRRCSRRCPTTRSRISSRSACSARRRWCLTSIPSFRRRTSRSWSLTAKPIRCRSAPPASPA